MAGDFCGVHKSTCSKTIRRVSRVLAGLKQHYIKLPETEEEITECTQNFFHIARFPNCIGAIDCSHVKIQSPGGDNAEIFRNRKQFFSLNVQTISDAHLKIQNIVTRWPGSAHDAHIFRNSAICASMETGRFGNAVLVGDSGYPVRPYLITPLLNVQNRPENLFNESLIRTRNVVERSYGVWKRRFPALGMGIRLKLDTTQALIVATAVLHNIACHENEPDAPINEQEEIAIDLVNNIGAENQGEIRGGANNATRHNLIQNYFARL